MIVEIGKGVQQGLLCPFIRSGFWVGSYSYARTVSESAEETSIQTDADDSAAIPA